MTSRKLPAVAASLALLAFATALFFPALFQGKILAPLDITTTLLQPWAKDAGGPKPHNHNPSDAVSQYLPYRIFAEKSLREDGYIGWNPYEMGGYSLAANTMALPGSWPVQLHRFLPFKDAWNLGIIGEFLIAGSGMLVFLCGRKLPWLPCLIGTVAFMFNAQFIIWIYHRWALGSFCWMPWVLWSFGNGFAAKPIQRRIFLLPAFLALALLGGSLQHVAFIILACGCMAAGHFDFRRPLANSSSLIGWFLAFVCAVGIAAFSLVPQISGYLSNIAIGHTRGGIGYQDGISQPLFHALLIPARIWPWLVGDPQTMDGWRLLKSSFMSLNYLGTIPILLGFAGLFVRSMPRAAKWLIAVGLIIPLTPLVGPLYHRVELLFILGAAWMTAEMLHHLQTPSSIKNQQSTINNRQSLPSSLASCVSHTWPRLLITTVAAIGIVLLAATCTPSGIRGKLENTVVSQALATSADSQFGADKQWIAARATEWTRRFSLTHPRTAWVYGLLVLGSTGLILSSSSKNQKSSIINHQSIPSETPSAAGTTALSAMALTQVETPSSALQINNQQSTILNRKSSPLLSYRSLGHLMILAATCLELATLFHTWTTLSDPADLLPKNAAIETVRSLAGPHRVLQSATDAGFAAMFATPNLLAAQSIPSIDGYESIQYRSALTATHGIPDDVRLTLAGVSLAVQPAGLTQPGTESWPVAATLGTYTLRKNPAVPSPISAGKEPPPTTPEGIATALASTTPIQPSLHTPNRWAFEVTPGQSWIRIAQNWHIGWQWRIPGQPWQPFRNGPDAACWIDAIPSDARHLEVQFFPRPRWLTFASIGTAIAWLCLLPVFRHFRKPMIP
jgi:hypothetical protein